MARISDKDQEKIIKALHDGKDLPTPYQTKLFESGEVDVEFIKKGFYRI